MRSKAQSSATRRVCALTVVLILAVLMAGAMFSPLNAQAARTPVIIIPGVAGSTFATTQSFSFYHSDADNTNGGAYSHTYGANETVWVNVWEAAFSGSDDYFDVLKLDRDADTPLKPYSQLRVSGIYYDAYNDLLDFLRNMGYRDGLDLFIFAYDWRRDIQRATFENLDALVNQARATAGTSQVDIIGHSMGGLVGRNYISTNSTANAKVRRLITLGTPILGSPKFFKALVYGDQFGPSFLGLGFNPEEIRDLVQNLGGGWQLLPSRSYYNFYNNLNSNLLSPYREDRDVDGDGVAGGALSYDNSLNFLRRLGKNQNAATFAQSFHNKIDNNLNFGGVRFSMINGMGLGTIGQIRDYTGTCWSWFRYVPCPKTDIYNVDGDGTVPYYSASPKDTTRSLNLTGNAAIHIVNREHGALVQYDRFLGIKTGDGPSLTKLGQILNNQVDTLGVSSMSFAFEDETLNTFAKTSRLRGVALTVTDGVQIEAIDEKGKRAGKKPGKDDQTENEIEGSNFDAADKTNSAFLPLNSSFILRFSAVADGSFDLKLRLMDGDTVQGTAVFLNVPVKKGQKAELKLDTRRKVEDAAKLRLELEGGENLAPTALLDANTSQDIDAPVINVAKPRQNREVVTFNWSADDDLAGLNFTQAVLDPHSDAPQLVQNGQRLKLSKGNHVLQVIAQDLAGNTAVEQVEIDVP
jgi:pimeloyl-ACP methyl ester carboxylesterase